MRKISFMFHPIHRLLIGLVFLAALPACGKAGMGPALSGSPGPTPVASPEAPPPVVEPPPAGGGLAPSPEAMAVAGGAAAPEAVPGAAGAGAGAVDGAQPACIRQISLAPDGADGSDDSMHPSISADGRYVAFQSTARNLVGGDDNRKEDIFVYDRPNGKTTRVSVSTSGAQANGNSTDPAISADGRYVAFRSAATDLVETDTNGQIDIFVHDRQTGRTSRVSLSTPGAQANGHSSNATISTDGRFVAFVSMASNLVEGDINQASDVFIHDRNTGETMLVSRGLDGKTANGNSGHPSSVFLIRNGIWVAFESSASNLVENDRNGTRDVFVYSRWLEPNGASTTKRVSVRWDGGEANGGSGGPVLSVSPDGSYVAFDSSATNLSAGDRNGKTDIFVHDLIAGTTRRVSLSLDGEEGNGGSHAPALSATGPLVAFDSSASNLVEGDAAGMTDLFVHDYKVGLITRVSLTASGEEPNSDVHEGYAISADGRYVVVSSSATNLIDNAPHIAVQQVFLVDLHSCPWSPFRPGGAAQ